MTFKNHLSIENEASVLKQILFEALHDLITQTNNVWDGGSFETISLFIHGHKHGAITLQIDDMMRMQCLRVALQQNMDTNMVR